MALWIANGLPHVVYTSHPLREKVRDEVLCVPCFDTEGEWISGQRFAATFYPVNDERPTEAGRSSA